MALMMILAVLGSGTRSSSVLEYNDRNSRMDEYEKVTRWASATVVHKIEDK